MSNNNMKVAFTILGQPCSKANSRQHVLMKGRMVFIKSKAALAYVGDFQRQCPQLEPPITDDVRVTMTIFYASRRPDLDESLILDCMQSKNTKCKKTKQIVATVNNIYANDRQVKEKHIYWALDKDNPRSEITVEVLSDTSEAPSG